MATSSVDLTIDGRDDEDPDFGNTDSGSSSTPMSRRTAKNKSRAMSPQRKQSKENQDIENLFGQKLTSKQMSEKIKKTITSVHSSNKPAQRKTKFERTAYDYGFPEDFTPSQKEMNDLRNYAKEVQQIQNEQIEDYNNALRELFGGAKSLTGWQTKARHAHGEQDVLAKSGFDVKAAALEFRPELRAAISNFALSYLANSVSSDSDSELLLDALSKPLKKPKSLSDPDVIAEAGGMIDKSSLVGGQEKFSTINILEAFDKLAEEENKLFTSFENTIKERVDALRKITNQFEQNVSSQFTDPSGNYPDKPIGEMTPNELADAHFAGQITNKEFETRQADPRRNEDHFGYQSPIQDEETFAKFASTYEPASGPSSSRELIALSSSRKFVPYGSKENRSLIPISSSRDWVPYSGEGMGGSGGNGNDPPPPPPSPDGDVPDDDEFGLDSENQATRENLKKEREKELTKQINKKNFLILGKKKEEGQQKKKHKKPESSKKEER